MPGGCLAYEAEPRGGPAAGRKHYDVTDTPEIVSNLKRRSAHPSAARSVGGTASSAAAAPTAVGDQGRNSEGNRARDLNVLPPGRSLAPPPPPPPLRPPSPPSPCRKFCRRIPEALPERGISQDITRLPGMLKGRSG